MMERGISISVANFTQKIFSHSANVCLDTNILNKQYLLISHTVDNFLLFIFLCESWLLLQKFAETNPLALPMSRDGPQ
jgi:hypothetical protein